MSLDTVTNLSGPNRADAARSAAATSARTDSPAPDGGFAALMQSLGESASAGESASGGSTSTGHDKSAPSADLTIVDPSAAAAASAAAAVVAATPTVRDTATSASRAANGSNGGTSDASARIAVASGTAAATSSRAAAVPTPGTTATAAAAGSLTGATTTPYLRQAVLLQQWTGAAGSADGQVQGLQGQAAAGANIDSAVTALATNVGSPSGTPAGTLPADSATLTLHLQAMVSDALQASVATPTALATGAGELSTLALAGLGDAAARPLSRSAASGGQDASSAGVALLGAATSANDVQVDVPASAPDAGATTEMRVAQQVTYWVGQGVQNASMEVQGIDEKPIHVSIALQGQEASVNFQAEQLQTQQILQASAPHLRVLLQSQGLVLSSLTVGGSGAGSAGNGSSGSASRDAPGGRQAQVLVPSATASASTSVGSGREGAALDLFV